MGLTDDLIEAKVQASIAAGATEEEARALAADDKSPMSIEAGLIKEAIVNFLTECEWKITKLNAPVVLETFKIPPQQGDILPSVVPNAGQAVMVAGTAGATSSPGSLGGGTNGVLNKTVDVEKDGGKTGILNSTGYVHIGGDPDSQNAFDVDDEDGQRQFTTVKLFREDIEDLL